MLCFLPVRRRRDLVGLRGLGRRPRRTMVDRQSDLDAERAVILTRARAGVVP